MGTMAQVEILAGSVAGLDEAFAILKRHEAELHIEGEGGSRLRAGARALSEEFRAETGGAFDARIGHLVRLWGWHDDAPAAPAAERIQAALALPRPVAEGDRDGWDFGGIGKGMAAAAAARALAESGAQAALINLGGNIQTIGAPPGMEFWLIGVRHPRDPDQTLGTLELPAGWAAATSGDYERFLLARDGSRLHHILDPATGWPAHRSDGAGTVVAVTVISADAATADAWSTAAFVLGWPMGLHAVEREPDLEAVFSVADSTGRIRTETTGGLRFSVTP